MSTEQTNAVTDRLDEIQSALAAIPGRWEQPPVGMIEKLPRITCPACRKSGNKVCPEHSKKKCDGCGQYMTERHIHLDYLGHAGVTRALIDVDPLWNWELGWVDGDNPIDAFAMTNPTNPTIMLGTLTILGVTRQCVGTVEAWKGPDTFKELIGDLLRNGAMRFGIGTALWAKGQWDDLPAVDEPPAQGQNRRSGAQEAVSGSHGGGVGNPTTSHDATHTDDSGEAGPVRVGAMKRMILAHVQAAGVDGDPMAVAADAWADLDTDWTSADVFDVDAQTAILVAVTAWLERRAAA